VGWRRASWFTAHSATVGLRVASVLRLDLARLLQPLREVVAHTGEVRGQRGVQVVELGFELGYDSERLGHRRVLAILRR
jgi:hypothetical protein